MSDHFFQKLGLSHTHFIMNAYHGHIRHVLANGYFGHQNVTRYSMSTYGAAGGMISSSSDVAHWVYAIFFKKIIDERQLKTFETTIPFNAPPKPANSRYGLGVYYSFLPKYGDVWWYSGVTNGYISLFLYLPKYYLIVAVTTNRIVKSNYYTLMPGNNFASQLLSNLIDYHLALNKKMKILENKYHGRLGVAMINTENGNQYTYHGNIHFPFASTFKFMLVAAMLNHANSDRDYLNKTVYFTNKLITKSQYAPVTNRYVDTGMTIKQLCKAAMTQSDNGAANVLLQQMGGPQAITRFARSIGDNNFNLVRYEPDLNTAIPGDVRDTTTPLAMVKSMKKILFTNILSSSSRKLLQQWMIDNKTGNTRIRAAAPKGWLVGDKTGAGGYGTTNDVAIIWPPYKKPILLVIFFTTHHYSSNANDKVIDDASNILFTFINTNEVKNEKYKK